MPAKKKLKLPIPEHTPGLDVLDEEAQEIVDSIRLYFKVLFKAANKNIPIIKEKKSNLDDELL